jgi:hypothetical protein
MNAPVSPASDEMPSADVATPEEASEAAETASAETATAAPPPAFTMPDRADAPVSEVTERFLRAVVAQVPLDRIEELHLFSPLRQGTLETGIAVIAARVPVVAVLSAFETQLGLQEAGEAVAEEADVSEAVPAEAVPADVAAVDAEAVEAEAVDAEAVAGDAGSADSLLTESRQPVVRHTVYTARYRYVIKGPERGKWEASVKAEAEAPLITVETVVRGVQRRAGEESEIVRYTGAQIARALRIPIPPVG